jgi:hypothetical protein
MHPPEMRTKGQPSGRRTGLSRLGQGAARSSPQTLGGPARRPVHRLIVAQRWSGFPLSDHPNSRRKEGSLDLRENKGFFGGQDITTTYLPGEIWPSLSDIQDLSGLQIGCQQKTRSSGVFCLEVCLTRRLGNVGPESGSDFVVYLLDGVGGPEHAGAAPVRTKGSGPNGTSLGAKPDWAEICEHFASRLLGLIRRHTTKNPDASPLVNNKSCDHNKILSPQNPVLEIADHSVETLYG